LIGNLAPAFDLPCTRFPNPARCRVALGDYRGRWLVLVFYPRDFSLVCPTELIGLSQRFDEFAGQGCELLGISCDSVESHERWIADHQTFDPFTALRPGNYFSHYLIEAEVGSGTFARVYRARDLQLDRPVALKVFKPDCPVTPSAALAEARAAAALNHPNLCT